MTSLHPILTGPYYSLVQGHIYQRLIHHNIEQIIDKPTRGDNIWLFLTNNKSPPQNSDALPPIGNADHDMVSIEINVRPNRQNTPHRSIFIFKESNQNGMKSKLSTLLNYMQSTMVNEQTQWTIFKTALLKAMQEFIPKKQINPKHCLPWVTQRICKLIRAKYRLHATLKHNPRPKTNTSRPVIHSSNKPAKHTGHVLR